jgi:hypothetical protein
MEGVRGEQLQTHLERASFIQLTLSEQGRHSMGELVEGLLDHFLQVQHVAESTSLIFVFTAHSYYT